MKRLVLASTALLAFTVPTVVRAADTVSGTVTDAGVKRYAPAFFAPFQATTALDMVQLVPGFSFNRGSQVRGFAGAAGNVLIDGQRPASKSGVDETLGAIPASQIEQVELITGSAPGVDMQGYRQVVNVVRRAGSKPTITISVQDTTMRGETVPSGQISYSANDHDRTDASLGLFRYIDGGAYDFTRTVSLPDRDRDPAPVATNIARGAGGDGLELKLGHSRPLWDGRLSLNGRYNPSRYDSHAQHDAPGYHADELYLSTDIDSELGVQFTRTLSSALSLDVDALSRHGAGKGDSTFADADGRTRYRTRSASGESILSASLNWQAADAVDVTASAEGAFNSLDRASLYTGIGDPENAPFDRVRVEERRGEYAARVNWQSLPTLMLAAGVRVETSTISVPAAGRSQSFVYPKPSLQLVWTPVQQFKISWRSERQVGQLNFNDFASSVSLDTDVVRAGNPNLVPQKQWHHAFVIDYVFWQRGAASLSFENDALEDTLDHIPIIASNGVYDARGNIGKATRRTVRGNISLPLDPLNIPGGMLKVDAYEVDTRVIDPISGQPRVISGVTPFDYKFDFSQTLTRWRTSWGFVIDNVNTSPSFNAAEYYDTKARPNLFLWLEYKTVDNLTFGVEMQNPSGRFGHAMRTVYAGLRGQSEIVRQDDNVSEQPPVFTLRLRKDL